MIDLSYLIDDMRMREQGWSRMGDQWVRPLPGTLPIALHNGRPVFREQDLEFHRPAHPNRLQRRILQRRAAKAAARN